MNPLNVLIIGGPPGAGKTTLARSLAGRLGFLSTTVDDLVSTTRFMTTPTAQPDLHRVASGGHTKYFTAGPPEKLIADAIALEEAMWPALERLILTRGVDKAPMVLDWWLFHPEKVATLPEGATQSLWLHIDPDVLEARERLLADFREGSTDPEQMRDYFMQRSQWRNELVMESATSLNLPVLHQSGNKSVESLTDEALTRIRWPG